VQHHGAEGDSRRERECPRQSVRHRGAPEELVVMREGKLAAPKQYSIPSNVPTYTRPFATDNPLK
jgi:hypothetical protein